MLVYDENGNVIDRYLHGPAVDQLFADESAVDGLLWALADRQGSIRDWADYDAGTDTTSVYDHVILDSFGNINSQSNPSHTVTIAFTARYHDPATGLQWNRARWYDPGTGRWLSEDPIGFAGGDVNLRRYVGNSPTIFVDPSGLDAAVVGDATNTHAYFLFDLPPAPGVSAPTIRIRVDYWGVGASWDNTDEAIAGCPGRVRIAAWPLPLYSPNPMSLPKGKPGLILEGGREEALRTLEWLNSVTDGDLGEALFESIDGYEPHDTETPELSAHGVELDPEAPFETYHVPLGPTCATFAAEAGEAYSGRNLYDRRPIQPSTLDTRTFSTPGGLPSWFTSDPFFFGPCP